MPRVPLVAISSICFVVATTAVADGDSLKNPKQLVPPIKLTRASYYMDGGSLGGTLTDSRSQHLDFFFDFELDKFDQWGDIYIGYPAQNDKKATKAQFDGWVKEDLYLIIEDTIRRQFVWDVEDKELRPKDPEDPISKAFAKDVAFGRLSVKRVLRHVERALHRKSTFMQ